ncbi:ABC transporter substrate-binding protein [Paenibacillus thalictri]|uniref:Sugar ABC transporter substrate-binding protein n=1 Tax=Paenibacillus thalictri TaxID=2527873 RepID=A0A4Q9DQV0_9BACL|nr:sugar ABC transporter substrate-binding protein [Paenibacillus thalictri]TBL76531.1 sugar ABC transporter substrate-binding protein [Paenibacillus thalictri]
MKPNLKKYVGMGLSAVLLAAALTGCGDGDKPAANSQNQAGDGGSKADKPFAGKTLQVFLVSHPWGESIKQFAPEFEQQTGMKVEFQSFFDEQFAQKLSVQLTTGSATPDVFMYRPPQEGKLFFKNGWIQPLDDFVKKDPSYDIADFSPSSIGSTTVDGKLAGIPVYTESQILYYRKDLLEKANIPVPKTLDELDAAIKKLHDPGNGLYGFVARGQRAAAVTQLSSFLFSEGADFTKDGKATVNTAEAVKAFGMYGSWLKDYGPPGVLNMAWPQAMGVFAQGKAAFFTDISSVYKNAIDPEKSTIKDKVGFAQFPAGKAGAKPFNVTPMGIAMNSKAANKDAAWEFIKWSTSKEMVLKLQKAGNTGARNSVWEKPDAIADLPKELYEISKEANKIGVDHDRPVVINVGEARDIVGTVIVKAILGENVKEAADKANQELQTLMDKEK